MSSQGISFPLNSAQARLIWSKELNRAKGKETWFDKMGFVGKDARKNLIVEFDDLEKTAGSRIRVNLRAAMRGPAVAGDNTLQGKEGSLDFMADDIFINQVRNGLTSKGKMSEQNVPYDLRAEMRDAQAEYWGVYEDEQIIYKLSGAVGAGAVETFTPGLTGYNNDGAVDLDGNPLRAPSANRIIIANGTGSAGGVSNGALAGLTSTDRFTLDTLDLSLKTATRIDGNPGSRRKLQRIRVGGVDLLVCLMDATQAADLKANMGGRWYDIEKARLQGSFKESGLIQMSLGVYHSAYGPVVLHAHEGMVKFNNYGAGGNVKACRALLMGAYAGVKAYGREGAGDKNRMFWYEEKDDRGNKLVVDSGMILGIQKTSYEIAPVPSQTANGNLNATREDFGVFAIDTAANW